MEFGESSSNFSNSASRSIEFDNSNEVGFDFGENWGVDNSNDEESSKTCFVEGDDDDVNEFSNVLKDSDENGSSNSDLEDHLSCDVIKSANGTPIFWIPIVDETVLPNGNMVFDSLKEAVDMYTIYSKKAGFDIRLASSKLNEGALVNKYVLCNRAGTAATSDLNSLTDRKGKQVRNRSSQMTGCAAKIAFKCIKETGKFFILTFVVAHNHELFTDSNVHMSLHKRKLDYYDQSVIHELNKHNIGSVKAHAVVKGLRGGYKSVGPNASDFKKFTRDLNAYVKDSDANLLVNLMELRRVNTPNFSFEFMLEKDELRALFWADGVAKRNYLEFSDVVSFDATFRTNKYNMVFVPFTSIDNHRRSVTLGAALLAKETAEYYIFILQAFLRAFQVQPKIVVTDQDPALSNAILHVFNKSTHRFCMWHIAKKLTDKVAAKILVETDFRKRLQRLVWNPCINAVVFEEKWSALIVEFGLEDNKWLKHMFSIRACWIPAFFKDTPLSALMRTTSRSESENNFFQSFMSGKSNLLTFMWKFDAAMDKQRNIQASNDYYSIHRSPKLVTCLPFEVQASKFYTKTLFVIVQKELYDSVWSCASGQIISFDGFELCDVVEQSLGDFGENRSLFFRPSFNQDFVQPNKEFVYQVKFSPIENIFECTCMVFQHHGFLCRHIFCVMKRRFIKEIPSKYLLRRWKKNIIRAEELEKNYSTGDAFGGCSKIVQEAYSVFVECIHLVGHDSDALAEFLQFQKDKRQKIRENPPKDDPRTQSEQFDALIGVPKIDVVQIRNPVNIRNKGCGSSKRLKSKREIALDAASNTSKYCSYCEKKVLPSEKHDRRNCPLRKEHEIQK